MRLNVFIGGMIGGALLMAAVAGAAVLNARGTVLFAACMAAGAVAAAFICSRWPGLEAAAWKLWTTALLANPVFLIGVGYSVYQYECLIGELTGWDCMFTSFGLIVSGLCVVPPAIGLALRQWRRRRVAPAPS
jgi:hypothetical protein